MSLLHTLRLTHLPENLTIYIALYQDVKNAAFLQQQLLQGNTAFEYAFLDASMILSSTHLLAAVFRAANDRLNCRLKSNNIAESFRRFGISPATTSMYAIKVASNTPTDATSIRKHLSDNIEGTPLPFTDLEIAQVTDIVKVRKIYKLTNVTQGNSRINGKGRKEKQKLDEGVGSVNGDQGQEDAERKELEIMVLGLMALRGAT
ncbi:MAG: hypothetical protein Q9186_003486 [Xanthomendoza sp. 1 TL-2023]